MNVQGLFYAFIYVSDLERSKKFYGETLGWKPGTIEKDVAGFSFGDAYLVIHADNRKEGKGQYGGGMWIAVKVDNVAGAHAELKANGVRVGEILKQPWGEHQFYFDDPDGYHWSFGQHVAPSN
ncbi:MAG: VOC family protein [Planctomycetes bacterium]|nr:VOC family protein [Planctomycetota bacterium]